MKSTATTYLAIGLLAFAVQANAIDTKAYRRINYPGTTAAEVLIIAGRPLATQRQDNCETWFYPGTDYALANRMLVVELCNKVISTSLRLAY